MSYYRRPYYSTILGRPYLTNAPITSDHLTTKREYVYEYSGKDEDDTYTSIRSRPRYYPVDDLLGPSHHHDIRYDYRTNPSYIPDFRATSIVSSPLGYEPRWYNSNARTVTRLGSPYFSRTYRY